MIEIDGATRSGSGTILRYGVAIATLLGEPIHIINIRRGRKKPGLRPQHLHAVLACRDLCEGKVKGANVNSKEVWYWPGPRLKRISIDLDIGTGGSATMLAFTLLPLALFSQKPSRIRLTGGLFQDFAPTAFHMERVLLPQLAKMGARVNMRMERPGYVPRGGGVIELRADPLSGPLSPLRLDRPGRLDRLEGVALSSHLKGALVSDRMVRSCQQWLSRKGLNANFQRIYDEKAPQKGAALFLGAYGEKGEILGADRAGKVGRTSEKIGSYVARTLWEDLSSGSTVDRYLADQLIIFAALASGASLYRIPRITEHIDTNLWLVNLLLNAEARVDKKEVVIKGIGFKR